MPSDPRAEAGKADDQDVYSDVDSEGFVQDMRQYGVGQALSFEVPAAFPDASAALPASPNLCILRCNNCALAQHVRSYFAVCSQSMPPSHALDQKLNCRLTASRRTRQRICGLCARRPRAFHM